MPGTVVFIFDDGYASLYSHVAPLFEAKGLRAAFAIGGKLPFSKMTEAQFLDLQRRGHEVMNHGRTHQNLASSSSNTNLARDEVVESLEELEALGLQVEGYVAANSVLAEVHIAKYLVPTHFCGFTVYAGDVTGVDALMPRPVDRYRMRRTGLHLAGVSGAMQTIDAAVAEDGIVVFYDHDPGRVDYTNSMSLAELEIVLNYCISSGVQVKLPTKMVADEYPEAYAEYKADKLRRIALVRGPENLLIDPGMTSFSTAGPWKFSSTATGSMTVSALNSKGLLPSRTILIRDGKPKNGVGSFKYQNDAMIYTERGQRAGAQCYSIELQSDSPTINADFKVELYAYARNAATNQALQAGESSGVLHLDKFRRRYSVSISPAAANVDIRIDWMLLITPLKANGADCDIIVTGPRHNRGLTPTK